MSRQGQMTIFMVEEDDETRPLLKRTMEAHGHRVIVAVNEEDAAEKLDGGHIKAHLFLVNVVGKSPEEALNVGRRLRRHARYDGQVPLVVIADEYGEDLEGKDANFSGNDWVSYPKDADQLKNLIDRLIHAPAAS